MKLQTSSWPFREVEEGEGEAGRKREREREREREKEIYTMQHSLECGKASCH